jgi:DNA-binding transcriptional regulator of glucitol operon
MPSYVWLIIIAAILLVWWLWSRYGGTYSFISNNPQAIGAGQSVARYYTDIVGLVNAYQAQDAEGGSFFSRMGTFVGALPK